MDRRKFIRNSTLTSGGILLAPSFVLGEKEQPLVLNHSIDEKINPSLLENKWDAQWLTYPEGSMLDYGVFHFRKHFKLKKRSESFLIHVSADNRYRLFINGKELGNGPAKGDLLHWRFDSYDIAKYLKEGENLIAAVVWNFGTFKAHNQMSYQTAFIVQGNSQKEKIINTNHSWKMFKNEAYKPSVISHPFTVVGPGDDVDGEKYPFGWESIRYKDTHWEKPKEMGKGIPLGRFSSWNRMLVSRSIPLKEHTFQRMNKIERTKGIGVKQDFLKGKSSVVIPANKEVNILLDQTFLTNAYPQLRVSGGKNALIKIGYAEALFDKNGEKGNRNLTKGKHLESAFWDKFRPDGGKNRLFSTLWFRTYRYLELKIETKENPIVLHDIYAYFTAYPFEAKALFESDDPSLKNIWDVGWRTARLCAGETYYDCPYYEQLQYIGDTRIQALISLYVAGDDRLMRNAIKQFGHSLLSFGLTQSRYPSHKKQVIPPFSLFWIHMIYDFWMHRNDRVFVHAFFQKIENVLNWFEKQMGDNGLLGPMNWWNFIDWSFGPWNPDKPLGGVPKGGMTGDSSILSLLYAYTLQHAADVYQDFGKKRKAKQWREQAENITRKVKILCWSKKRSLLADTPEKNDFSQHANILGVLTGLFEKKKQKEVIQKILTEKDLTETTFYFKFYLFLAMKKAGLANEYLQQLNPWREMLDLGLTTFAETPEPTRSDCHAWSAHPIYDMLATVCGIMPASPGFKTIKIAPHLGNLSFVKGEMPHPKGNIKIYLKAKGESNLSGEIILPKSVSGIFKWRDKEIKLYGGKQFI